MCAVFESMHACGHGLCFCLRMCMCVRVFMSESERAWILVNTWVCMYIFMYMRMPVYE